MEDGSNVIAFKKRDMASPAGDSGDETTPRSVQQPQLSHGKLAHANMERSFDEFEQTIDALIKETDGSSRTIPRFRQLLKDMRTHHAVLKP